MGTKTLMSVHRYTKENEATLKANLLATFYKLGLVKPRYTYSRNEITYSYFQ